MLIGIFYSQVVESSSLVSVLFREAISHPYISFFHLLVNGFSVISLIVRQCCGGFTTFRILKDLSEHSKDATRDLRDFKCCKDPMVALPN